MSEPEGFDYGRLWYIPIRDGEKLPAERWGGYGQEFDEVEHVHRADDLEDLDHDRWGACGYEAGDSALSDYNLFVIDFDFYEQEDSDFGIEDITSARGGSIEFPVAESPSGGAHAYAAVADSGRESDFDVEHPWIDLRGEAVKAHVVAPSGIPGNAGSDYELVYDTRIPVFNDFHELCESIGLGQEYILEYTGSDPKNFDFEIAEDAPDDMPYCYRAALSLRQAPDEIAEAANHHKVNTYAAMLGLSHGYDPDAVIEHFKEFPPEGDDANVDEDLTEYHVNLLAEKFGRKSLSPPSLKSLQEVGILSAGETCDCDLPNHESNRRDPADLDYTEIRRGRAILQAQTTPTEPAGDLEHKNGCYGYKRVIRDENGERKGVEFETVTNFTLKTQAILDTHRGKLMRIEVEPNSPLEESYEVTVHPQVFNEPRKFREEVVRGLTTAFTPQRKPAAEVLAELRRTVGSQNARRHQGTEHIGLHGDGYDELVTPEGTLKADGWSDDPEYLYYAKGGDQESTSALAEKWQLSPDQGHEYDPDVVAEICETLPWVRLPDRGLPVLAWYYSAPLRPLITDWTGEGTGQGQFNLLQVAGGTETGKTSALELYYQLLGADPTPYGCDDTKFTTEKKLATSCGLPVWLDEYKPSDMAEGKVKSLHRTFRNIYRGYNINKGRGDLSDVTFRGRAPLVFSGEQTVEEPAVRRRTIITRFSTKALDGEQRDAYQRLLGAPLHNHALAYYRYVLDVGPETLREWWDAAEKRAKQLRDRLGYTSIEDNSSEMQGLQTVVFGYRLFREFATAHGADESELPGQEYVEDAVAHLAENIGAGGRRREHIDEFTELVAQAATDAYLEEGVNYRTLSSQKFGKEVLAFHMPSTFNQVKRYVREYNLEEEYSLLSKNDYVDSYADKVEAPKAYPLATSKRVRGLEAGSKAVFIDPDLATETLGQAFPLKAFFDDEDGEAVGDAPEEIQAVAAGAKGTTLEGRVETVDTPPADQVAQKARLVDETGEITVTVWADANIEDLEEGSCYRLYQVEIDTWQGDLTAYVNSHSDVQQIQEGVGNAPGANVDAEGRRAAAQHLVDLFRKEGVESREEAVTPPRAAGMAGDDDLDPDTVARALEYGAAEMNPALFQRDSEASEYWLN
jgi:hypothetical protein